MQKITITEYERLIASAGTGWPRGKIQRQALKMFKRQVKLDDLARVLQHSDVVGELAAHRASCTGCVHCFAQPGWQRSNDVRQLHGVGAST